MQEVNQPSEKIIEVNLEEQMKSAYTDYAMSVIVSRAFLPDVRDGFKPAIGAFSMEHELGTCPIKHTRSVPVR